MEGEETGMKVSLKGIREKGNVSLPAVCRGPRHKVLKDVCFEKEMT